MKWIKYLNRMLSSESYLNGKYIEMFEVLLGQKFIYTQHWHGCQGKFGVLIICLNCSFSRVE